MAVFTRPNPTELRDFLAARGVRDTLEIQPVEGGSVNSNFRIRRPREDAFLRLYEAQDLEGAKAEATLVATLASRGVPTPCAIGEVSVVGDRPAVLLPWVEGTISCQASVTAERAREVGAALARVHRAGDGLPWPPNRFGPDALRARLDAIADDRFSDEVAHLRGALGDVVAARTSGLPRGLVHGDLFRDNVLWQGDALVALLDFESASEGVLVYDLAVTILAWTYGDTFSPELVRALVAGYQSIRPLEAAELAALWTEARLACIRFTITRITDYALRKQGTGVMKDWRRFRARLEEIHSLRDALTEAKPLDRP